MNKVKRHKIKDKICRTSFADKLCISKEVTSTLYLTYKQVYVPLQVNCDVSQLVKTAEKVSSLNRIPIEHDLTPPMTLILKRYQRVGEDYGLTVRKPLRFASIHSAYLYLRAFQLGSNGVKYEQVIGDSLLCITGSQDCTMFSKLQRRMMGLDTEDGVVEGHCPRCLSAFVILEAEENNFCLECGYDY